MTRRDDVTFPLGQLVRVQATFTDDTDAVADPSNVFFSYIAPGGTQTDYQYGVGGDVTKVSTGVYYINVNGSVPGKYRVRAYATGTGQAAVESYFEILASPFT